MSESKGGEIIQYVPFMSFVHPSFWHSLTELKLNVDKLNETTKRVYGHFTYRNDIGTVFEVDGTSFNETPNNDQFCETVKGTIMNKNTIEDFKAVDKANLLNSFGETFWTETRDTWLEEPRNLLKFIVLSFADLKKFHYYYWFAFPSPSQPTVYLKNNELISSHFTQQEMEILIQAFKNLPREQKCFFTVFKNGNEIVVATIKQVLESEFKIRLKNIYFVFEDPSCTANPGWPLRLFLAALLDHCTDLKGSELNVIGFRYNPLNGTLDNSRVFTIRVPENVLLVGSAGWVGWERNDKGNFGPKLANMSASMDPVKLAETSSDLNIKLMKWRLVPNLDVNVMKKTKCLLLGAGTLGCHVARNLLAWGFRHITFLDNGKVSYSNPTRQVLFNFQDCLHGGKAKAQAAADNLKTILPTVDARAITAHIPMPGHPVGETLKEETIEHIQIITDAIQSHDVIFLLLDTREARWLPALLSTHFNKIVMNAALGFDSYLVMRHGASQGIDMPREYDPIQLYHSKGVKTYAGAQLGCYFCNDVTAPGNSLKDRTLDQQCTVTRPGVAAIAGALVVEILVGLLQHPLRDNAPAFYYRTNCSEDVPDPDPNGVLGSIPHSIRGYLYTYQTVLPTVTKFPQCIACSDKVLSRYREEGIEFLLKVFNSGKYLEEITGLAELQMTAELSAILMLSDDSDDDSSKENKPQVDT